MRDTQKNAARRALAALITLAALMMAALVMIACPAELGPPQIADLYGTYVSNDGHKDGPITLTISATTIKWTDKNGNYVQYNNVQWGNEAANTATGFPAATLTYIQKNHPTGFEFTSTPAYQGITPTPGDVTYTIGFLSLAPNRQSVYVGKDASQPHAPYLYYRK